MLFRLLVMLGNVGCIGSQIILETRSFIPIIFSCTNTDLP